MKIDELLGILESNKIELSEHNERRNIQGYLLVLRKCPEISQAFDNKIFSIIHVAALAGHTNICAELISTGKENVKAVDKEGMTALHHAAIRGDAVTCEKLVKLGADVDARDFSGRTAFHRAAMNGHAVTCVTLFKNGVDVNAVDFNGATALHYVAKDGNPAIFKELLKIGADVNASTIFGTTILHMLASWGHAAICKELLKIGVDVNAKDTEGVNALHCAAINGDPATCKELLKIMADLGAKDNFGRTALHKAVPRGHADACKILIENGMPINPKDQALMNGLKSLNLYPEKDLSNILLRYGCFDHLFVETSTDNMKARFVDNPASIFCDQELVSPDPKLVESYLKSCVKKYRDKGFQVESQGTCMPPSLFAIALDTFCSAEPDIVNSAGILRADNNVQVACKLSKCVAELGVSQSANRQ